VPAIRCPHSSVTSSPSTSRRIDLERDAQRSAGRQLAARLRAADDHALAQLPLALA
jgi:hypothetical protein